jgi:hypothetical protein
MTRRRFAATLPAAAGVAGAAPAQPKARPRRADSFLGFHFDLHPGPGDPALGRDVTPEMVGRLLDITAPDYIQYDSKGHVGWLGWPSEVGPSAPGIVKDSLEVWRRLTAERGVALYIHFSGVWDGEACRRHPEWARVGPDGKVDDRLTSTFGPYVDQLMLRQLREAATKYDLDGVWVDGECWATAPDYYTGVEEAFRKATGLEKLPRKAGEPGWLEFLELNREQFRRYVRHWVEEMHRSHPRFQAASNWLYSTMVPEEPALPVDFLSGDYLGNASISTARLDARYLAQTGKPWDLMAWGFQQAQSNAIGSVHKPAVQLQQEAAVVLAQGGGFQVYYQPSRAGHFEDGHIETMGSVARFCRARQAFSHKTETVPQIGVVFSRESLYRTTNRMFGGWGKAVDAPRGWIDALVGCGWSVDVVPDWKLARVASSYPFLVLPEWDEPGDEVKRALVEYASAGGKLLVAGARNARRFAAEAGVKITGEPAERGWWVRGRVLGNVKGLWQDVEPDGAKVIAERYPQMDTRSGGRPAATAKALGKGEIVLVPGPVGLVYAATHAATVRQLVASLVGPRFESEVEVSAPPVVEMTLRKKDGRLLVHLLNTASMQVAGDFATVDYIPAVGPVWLTLGKTKPKSVRLLPDDVELEPLFIQEKWMVQVETLRIHAAVAVVR